MQDEYRTVAREGVHETEINRSRFLCALAPAATEREAQDFVARIRKEHPTASHNCYAYVIGADASVQKASDDGEPGGTAGVPMLQMLTRREMRYVVAVVTRYYGGVKLGAGGLIRAYGGAVGEALDALGTSPGAVSGSPPSPSTTSAPARCRTICGPRDVRCVTSITGRRSRSRSVCRTPTWTRSARGWPMSPPVPRSSSSGERRTGTRDRLGGRGGCAAEQVPIRR